VSERKEVAKLAGTGLFASFTLLECNRAIPKQTRKAAEKTRRIIATIPGATAKLATKVMTDRRSNKEKYFIMNGPNDVTRLRLSWAQTIGRNPLCSSTSVFVRLAPS